MNAIFGKQQEIVMEIDSYYVVPGFVSGWAEKLYYVLYNWIF
jgi:hypothetical protein